jgi:hypothetical protein
MVALWRVDLVSDDGKARRRADVVCSVNVNQGKDGQVEVEKVKAWWEEAVKGLTIQDYALFAPTEA